MTFNIFPQKQTSPAWNTAGFFCMLPLGRTHSYLSWKLTKGYWLVGSFCLICCVKISFKFCHHDCCEGTTSISPVLQLVICKVSCCTVCCGRRLCQYHRSVGFLKHFDLLDFTAASTKSKNYCIRQFGIPIMQSAQGWAKLRSKHKRTPLVLLVSIPCCKLGIVQCDVLLLLFGICCPADDRSRQGNSYGLGFTIGLRHCYIKFIVVRVA